MFRVEILKSWHRLRTWIFATALAGVAVLPVIILATSSGNEGGGPPFFEQIRSNGLFAGLAAIGLVLPFFLPLGTGLLSGEAVSSEAGWGTLRYLLIRPVGRVRLVAHKYAAVMAQIGASVLWVMAVGLIAGGIAFGYGDLPTLSGQTIGSGEAMLRILASAAYVTISMAGVAALGLFVSTLTDSAPGAAVATVFVVIVSEILDGLTALRGIHPYLLSHRWLAFVDLFRNPAEWGGLVHGLVLAAAYTALFLGLAMFAFGRKDVTS